MFKFLLGAILFFPLQLFSQWTIIPSNTANKLNDVFFTSRDTGFIAGDSVMLMTSDAGMSWEKINLPNAYNFNTIHFPSKLVGYTNGLKTLDGGISWDPINPITSSWAMYSMYFINDTTGFYVSGWAIGKTTDGGFTWSEVQIPGNTMVLEDVVFTTDSIGYAGGTYIGDLYKTIDQGNSWFSVLSNPEELFSINFPSQDTGYAAGWNNNIIKTTDGGNTWSRVQTGLSVDIIFYDIFCLNNNDCCAVGANETIIKTIDGGQNWTKEKTPTIEELNSIYCTDSFCVSVGYNGIILRTNLTTGHNPVTTSESSVSVFPNPVNTLLTIQIHIDGFQKYEFEMYNLSGQIMSNISLTDISNSLDISAYPNGIYFYKISNSDGSIKLGKIIKL